MPPDASSGTPWVTIAGLVALFGTPVVAYLIDRLRKRSGLPLTGLNSPPSTPPTPLNADTTTANTSGTGFTSIDVRTLLRTVRETQADLVDALSRIEVLEQHDRDKEALLVQAVMWGVNALGDPPRVPPEFLKVFLQQGGNAT